MSQEERPIPDRLEDQEAQAQHLRRTGNGPTIHNETELLAAVHGSPDMAGYYTGPELAVAEAPVEAPVEVADDTADGGESA